MPCSDGRDADVARYNASLQDKIDELTEMLCWALGELDQGRKRGVWLIRYPSTVTKWWATHQELDNKRGNKNSFK